MRYMVSPNPIQEGQCLGAPLVLLLVLLPA